MTNQWFDYGFNGCINPFLLHNLWKIGILSHTWGHCVKIVKKKMGRNEGIKGTCHC